MKPKNGTQRGQWQLIAFFLFTGGLYCIFRSVSDGFLNPLARVVFAPVYVDESYILWKPDSQQILFRARLNSDLVFATDKNGQGLHSAAFDASKKFPKNSEDNPEISFENYKKLAEKYGDIAGAVLLPEAGRRVLITSYRIDGFIASIYTERLHLLDAATLENLATIDVHQLLDIEIARRGSAYIFCLGVLLELLSALTLLHFAYPQRFRILRILAFVIILFSCYICSVTAYFPGP